MTNADVIARLYEGLRTRNGEQMAACYTPDARFEDPAFGVLIGPQIGGMWRMLTSSSDGIDVELTDLTIDGDTGTARWVARYTFTTTGRRVVNRVSARYRFDHGLISEHIDTFSFHRWARQALGPIGLLLGWTPFLQTKIRHQARRTLDRFLAAPGEAEPS